MDLPQDFCPYQGLKPYTKEESKYFFGREKDQQTIAANLMTTPLTILYGASGVGKTSVLLAGVVPLLEAYPDLIVIVFRKWQNPSFLPILKLKIAQAVAERTGESIPVDDLRLDQVLQKASQTARCTITVILDQFEEYFLYHPEEDSGHEFEAEFARAVNRNDVDANFLLALREDGLSHLDRFQGRIPNLFGNYLRLDHLDRPSAERAIRKPLKKYNEDFKPVKDITPGEGLVEQLLEDVQTVKDTSEKAERGHLQDDGETSLAEEDGAIRIETPLLQMVLERLWKEEMEKGSSVLRLSTYEDLGWSEEIVNKHLVDVIKDFSDDEKKVCSLLFDRLVTPTGSKIAYPIQDLKEYAGELEKCVDAVLQKLVDGRILRIVDQPGRQSCEIFHDVLARAILDWRDEYVKEQELNKAEAKAAKAAKEATRFRRLAIALGIFVFVTLVMLVIAVMSFNRAEDAGKKAELAQATAEQISADLIKVNAEVAGRNIVIEVDKFNQQIAYLESRVEGYLKEVFEPLNNNDPDQMLGWAYQANEINLLISAGRELHGNPEIKTNTYLDIQIRPETQAKVQKALLEAVYASGTRKLINQGAPVYSAVFGESDEQVISGAGDGSLTLWEWDPVTEEYQKSHSFISHTGIVWDVAVSPDIQKALSGGEDGQLILRDLETGEILHRFEGHDDAVLSVAISEDGNKALSGSKDHDVILWDLESGELIKRFEGHNDWVWSVAFTPDGERALSGSEDNSLIVWNIENGEMLLRLESHSEGVKAVAIDPGGKTALSASFDDTLIWWDLNDGKMLKQLPSDVDIFNEGSVLDVAFMEEGRRALAGYEKGALILWDLESGTVINRFKGHSDWVRAVTTNKDGSRLLSGSDDRTLRLWDFESSEKARTITFDSTEEGHASGVFGVALSPDGDNALSGAEDGSLILWEIKSGKVKKRLEENDSWVWDVAFSPDGQTALSGSGDTLILWDLEKGEIIRRFEEHDASVYATAFSSDGRFALSGDADGTLILWNVENEMPIHFLEGHVDGITAVKFSEDGRTALSGSFDYSVIHWDLDKGEPIQIYNEHNASVYAADIRSDGRTAISGDGRGEIILWDLENRQLSKRFEVTDDAIIEVALDADDGTVILADRDGSLIRLDLGSGEELDRFEGNVYGWRVAFYEGEDAADTAIKGLEDGSLVMWDVDSGKIIQRFGGAIPKIRVISLSHEGKTALTGSENGVLILWDLENDEVIRRFSGHEQAVTSLAISSDGHTAVSGYEDADPIVWNLDTGDEITVAEGQTTELSAVTVVTINPKDDTAMSGFTDGSLTLWDIRTGVEISHIQGSGEKVNVVSFTSDGQRALAGYVDGSLILYDVDTGEELQHFKAHATGVSTLAISPIEDKALSASSDGSLILWDLQQGESIREFEISAGDVIAVTFSPDGTMALSGSKEGKLILWHVDSGLTFHEFDTSLEGINSITFTQDERYVLTASYVASDPSSVSVWRVLSPEGLIEWIDGNRYKQQCIIRVVKELDIIEFCPSATPIPVFTSASTFTAVSPDTRMVVPGEKISADLPVGGRHLWTYEGRAGEAISIRVESLRPANKADIKEQIERKLLDPVLVVYHPDGSILAKRNDEISRTITDPVLYELELPVTGEFKFEIRNELNLIGGKYTFTLMYLITQNGEIEFDVPVEGSIDSGVQNHWTFDGEAGQIITIVMEAIDSLLSPQISLLGPDELEPIGGGGDIDSPVSFIEGFELPASGTYTIIASGIEDTEGAYELSLFEGN